MELHGDNDEESQDCQPPNRVFSNRIDKYDLSLLDFYAAEPWLARNTWLVGRVTRQSILFQAATNNFNQNFSKPRTPVVLLVPDFQPPLSCLVRFPDWLHSVGRGTWLWLARFRNSAPGLLICSHSAQLVWLHWNCRNPSCKPETFDIGTIA